MQANRRMSVVEGDITTLEVDAIVNAANSSLLGGGGVDGAIHRGAGPDLVAACRKLNGCETGDAKITPGFGLPARHVIHTVGPVWSGGEMGEPALLASCYRRSLEVAVENSCRSVAFPAISTGVFRFPPHSAAEIAVSTVWSFLEDDRTIADVIFCCFGQESTSLHRETLERVET